MFGIIVWLVAPAYASRYQPNLADERTLRFSPNAEGGYDVSEIPFHLEADLGQKKHIEDVIGENDQIEVDFPFPFYGRVYQSFFIHNDGVIAFGEKVNMRNLQYRLSAVPAILLGLIDLKPEASSTGGVFVKQDDDRLVVTFLSVPSFYYPEQEYTYQSILYADGTFEITHAGLPIHPAYRVNDRALASIWAVGAKPSLAPAQTVVFSNLPIQSGAEGVLHDEYMSFRKYLHDFLQPLAVAIFLVSLFFLLGLAMLFKYGFAQPLDALLTGVQAFNSGECKINLPVRYNDEIGFLTHSFNTLAAELDDVLSNLEVHIADQTSDLQITNEQLRKLTIAIEQSPASIVITDSNGHIEYVNPAFTQISGYTMKEVLGKNPRILKSGQTPEETFSEMWAKIAMGEVWRGELANQRKNGELYWEYTVIAPILNTAGKITHYVAIKEDVTDRHNAEMALRESEMQYRQLFELESDAIFIIRNEDGRILQANSASAHLYGYTVDELLALRNSDLSAEPEQTQKAT
ncbi:MAG: PAS domain S-box protein [Chloroflexi bacterium]|nr:PAS domain S-box protein [Chloroflexota bacterium]